MTNLEIVDQLMQDGKLNDKIAEWVSIDQEMWDACACQLVLDKNVECMVQSYRINNPRCGNGNGG